MKNKKTVRYGILFLAATLATVSCSSTPEITGTDGRPVEGSIAVMEEVELNGSSQWITIRGRDRDKPLLLFLSGGPGGSQLPSTRLHLGALEHHFIVVNWDQPGAGKSYRAVDIDELTPERYLEDGEALINLLLERFGQEKLFILGESWGTILGIRLANQVPDNIAAFIGSGQMVNTTENDIMGYRFALELLEKSGDTRRLEKLKKQGPPPYTEGNLSFTYMNYMGVLNDYMNAHARGEGEQHDIMLDALHAPEYSLVDKINWLRGLVKVFNRVYPQLADLELRKEAPSLEVPVYFILGRYDVNAMTSLAEDYYRILEAPHKELIWFEKSGHPPLYSEAGKLVDLLVRISFDLMPEMP